MLGYASIILKKLGASIGSSDEENGSLASRIYDILGEEELKKYRKKREYGIERRLGDQKIMSRVPMGYKVVNGRMIVDEEILEKMIEILTMLYDYEENITTISTRFNMARSTLAYMRRNSIYITG